MALPTLVKTYEHDINNQGGISSDNYQDIRRTMFQMKDALTGGGSGGISTKPMLVSRSCDSVSHGITDYWLAYTNIVVANINHSWIVLRSQGTIPYEICIDMQDASPHLYQLNYIGVSMGGLFSADQGNPVSSPNRPTPGPSLGSLSERPSAPDERQVLGSDISWAAGRTVSFLSRIHVIMSTDGDMMMMIVHIDNVPTIVWRYDLLQDPTTGYINGMHVWMRMQVSLASALSFSEVTTSSQKWSYDGLADIRGAYISYEAYNSTETAAAVGFTIANEWDNDWPFYPLGVWTVGTKRGRVGTITDMWLGSVGTNEADHYPDVPTLYQFAQVGDLIIPWDSANQILTS